MKKLISIVLLITVLCTLAACADKTPTNGENVLNSTQPPENGTATFSEGSEEGGVATLPEYGGKPVDTSKECVYEHGETEISFIIPASWEYEKVDASEESNNDGGLDLHPGEHSELVYKLRFSDEPVGLCGTGVTFDETELENGYKATICTESSTDGNKWMLIIPQDTPVYCTLEVSAEAKLVDECEAQVIEIMGTLTFN